jgi:hypothetical protein
VSARHSTLAKWIPSSQCEIAAPLPQKTFSREGILAPTTARKLTWQLCWTYYFPKSSCRNNTPTVVDPVGTVFCWNTIVLRARAKIARAKKLHCLKECKDSLVDTSILPCTFSTETQALFASPRWSALLAPRRTTLTCKQHFWIQSARSKATATFCFSGVNYTDQNAAVSRSIDIETVSRRQWWWEWEYQWQ